MLSGVLFAGCSGAQLDPERIAANIHLRALALQVHAGPHIAQAGLRAGVEACNRNDVEVVLVRADWAAQLDSIAIGSGQVDGPVTLAAQTCSELKVLGQVDLTRVGAAAVSALLLGQPLAPELVVDVEASVWGVHVRRKVYLRDFAAAIGRDAGADAEKASTGGR